MDLGQFESRKRDHIRHALDEGSQARGLSGLDQVTLEHEAMPELDFDEVSLASDCLGHPLETPFFVSGMTAGHPDAAEINLRLALACAERGWALGVGSQRRELEASGSGNLDRWAEIRKKAPRLVLFGNLGIAQVITAPIDRIRALVDALEAQALCVHLNALQEVMQPEGTPRFRGAAQALEKLCRSLGVPVVAKETGCGMSSSTLERLMQCGVAAVDVSGLGGTHWGRIEGARAKDAPHGDLLFKASLTFADWGISTVSAVKSAKQKLFGGVQIWASGGVRTGLDSAKLLSLGADRIGYARPALEAALEGSEGLSRWMELQEFELKAALFCTGSKNPGELRRKSEGWKRSAN